MKISTILVLSLALVACGNSATPPPPPAPAAAAKSWKHDMGYGRELIFAEVCINGFIHYASQSHNGFWVIGSGKPYKGDMGRSIETC